MPDQIQIIERDNSILDLFQKEPLRSVTKAEQVQDLLGQDVVNISVTSVEPLDLQIGQKVTVFGKTYFLNQLPTAQVRGERQFEYELTFEGPQYTLRRASFFNTDITGFNTSSDFPLTGNAEMFLDVILNNLVRVFGAGAWVKGEFPTTAVKTIPFNDSNCFSALQTICKEFETEFDIVQSGSSHTLHIREAGQILGQTYQYGRGYGLYELKRETVVEADIVTRLYPFGSTKNIKSNYRNFSQRLRIADPGYIQDPAAVAAFGIIEGVRVFEDIYPRRTGVVTGVSGVATFQDSTMNFDLAETDGSGTKWILDGSTPKIHFNTGNLAGYEFSLKEVGGYVHSTKTFTMIPFKDERDLELPNPEHAAFQMQVGDEYVILDIVLPDTYVESAEAELLFKGQQAYDQGKSPKVQYSLKIDEMYLANLAGTGSIVNFYGIGDYVHILDSALAIDKSSRVIGLRRDVLSPYKYELTIDDTYEVSIIRQIIDKIRDTDKIIKINDLRDPNRARMGWKTTLELLAMVFDTDGYFDGGKIKPESIETMMLVVGAKSQQFILQDVVFQPNFEGNANVVEVSEGLLIHYALKEEILTWNIQASTHTIPDNAARYIYAKVSKTNYNEGHIVFDTAKILPDQDPTFYHFLIGTLHSVMEGVRWISLTYGATAINGRFIKTGRVQSFDGRTWFDLDLGAIGGYIKFIDSEGNYRDLSDIGAATDRFYELSVINPPESYVNGKITAWFQATPPDTWPSGENSFHEGDTWYKSNTGSVWRFISGDWTSVSDPATIASYTKQYTRVGNNTHTQLFTAQPVAPYKDGDLWMSEEGLRRSIADKVTGQPFDPNNWVEPFNFDNTAAAIDGYIITSGIIQLAGDKNAIWAGISGQGTTDDSVRFWSGASTLNRDTAPLRIFQGGWLKSRKYIEVEGWNASSETYEGQAWLAGWGGPGEEDDGLRIGAGSSYENRLDAPFSVTGDGFMRAKKGKIAGLTIEGQSLTNKNEDGTFDQDAQIIFRDDPKDVFLGLGTNVLPASLGGIRALARYENNEPNSDPGHVKYGAIFEASGGSHATAMNYAVYSDIGQSLIGEFIHNGDKTIEIDGVSGSVFYVDPTKYNFIIVKVTSPGAFITLIKENGPLGSTYANPLRNGNEVTILPVNNQHGVRLWRSLRPVNSSDLLMQGGEMVTVKYYNGAWYTKSKFDSDY